MRILIATPLYPPQAGGPAKYAAGLNTAFNKLGYTSTVVAYGRLERLLPTGLRHAFYFLRLLLKVFSADVVVSLDAASVGVPAYFAARLAHKKILVRLGGDFVWEQYIERTKKPVTLKAFNMQLPTLTVKERLMYRLCRRVLRRADRVAFNSAWFRDIIVPSYGLNTARVAVIENEMPSARAGVEPMRKNFLLVGRQVMLKNAERAREAFALAKAKRPELVLEEGVFTPAVLQEKLRTCYAVLQPSLSDIAPNLVLEGLAFGKPFVMTRESGFAETLKGYGFFVDPLRVEDIAEKIGMLAEEETYAHYTQQAKNFSRTHTFDDIAHELLALL